MTIARELGVNVKTVSDIMDEAAMRRGCFPETWWKLLRKI
jgi:hypothetical protein